MQSNQLNEVERIPIGRKHHLAIGWVFMAMLTISIHNISNISKKKFLISKNLIIFLYIF